MTTNFLPRAALTLAAGVLASAAIEAADISGRIVGDGGTPVRDAAVLLLSEGGASSKPGALVRVQTREDGKFDASGLTGQSYRIRVEARAYAPLTQPGIPVGANVHLRVQRGVTIKGIVRDRSSGHPLSGASVFVWDKDGEPFGEGSCLKAASGKDGRFVVENVPASRLMVEARHAGHAASRTAWIDPPKTELALGLDIAGGLSGLVSDRLGEPILGAEVRAYWREPGGAKSRSTKTGADGRFRIKDAGAFPVDRMTVRAAKFLDEEREGGAPSDGVVNFTLDRGGIISGVVRGYDGKTPSSFRMKVRAAKPASPEAKTDRSFTDPAGAFQIDELSPGSYAVEVVADRYATLIKKDIVVAADQVSDVGTWTLESRARLVGRVVAARDHAPVSGALVRITLGEQGWTETTDALGAFATDDLPQGTLEVAIEHPQYTVAERQVSFEPEIENPELVVEMFRGGSLAGTVVNGNEEPVPGARIVATRGADPTARTADTGPDGRYFIEGLTPGTYSITRQGEAGTSTVDTKVATIRESETTIVDFDEQARILVQGTVLRGETPIPEATVSFISTEGGGRRVGGSTRSDLAGGYQMGLRRGGRYQVAVVFGLDGGPNAHNVVMLDIPDEPEVHKDIVFNVQSITGRVTDKNRAPVKGVVVTALRDGNGDGNGVATGARQTLTTTAEDGTFRLDAIDPGTYRVTARARAYAAAEAYPVAVQENEPGPDLELSMERGWILRGRVLDPAGKGVGGALIVVAPPGAAESGFLPTQSDAAGTFRITAPADGTVNVSAIVPRFAPAVQTGIEMPADGRPGDVVLQMGDGGALRVRVVRRNGDPMPGQSIAYQPVPLFPGSDVVVDRNPARSTGADGITRVQRLYPGTYLVSLAGRRDVPVAQAVVTDGTETEVVLQIP